MYDNRICCKKITRVLIIVARELCFRLLSPQAKRRFKGKQVLEHEWFWILLSEEELKEKMSQKYL